MSTDRTIRLLTVPVQSDGLIDPARLPDPAALPAGSELVVDLGGIGHLQSALLCWLLRLRQCSATPIVLRNLGARLHVQLRQLALERLFVVDHPLATAA